MSAGFTLSRYTVARSSHSQTDCDLMDTQDDFDLGTAPGPEDLQQGQSDATLLKQVYSRSSWMQQCLHVKNQRGQHST